MWDVIFFLEACPEVDKWYGDMVISLCYPLAFCFKRITRGPDRRGWTWQLRPIIHDGSSCRSSRQSPGHAVTWWEMFTHGHRSPTLLLLGMRHGRQTQGEHSTPHEHRKRNQRSEAVTTRACRRGRLTTSCSHGGLPTRGPGARRRVSPQRAENSVAAKLEGRGERLSGLLWPLLQKSAALQLWQL